MAKTKAVKKTAPKKTAAKKGIPRAPEGQYFVLTDGRRLGDLKELADALETMADHIWDYHVNWERNDFATWINDVFKETALAERLRKASGKHHAQIVIYRHILENN